MQNRARSLATFAPSVNEEFRNGIGKVAHFFAAMSVVLRRQKPFGINGRRATRARRGDGLTINVIRAVARHETRPAHWSSCPCLGTMKPFSSDFDLALKNFRVRHVADGDKHARTTAKRIPRRS